MAEPVKHVSTVMADALRPLVRLLEARLARQRAALAETEAQLAAARSAMPDAR